MSYDFADRLIEMRRSRGLSQEELAKDLGLSRQAISKWERAESAPDIGNLVALANIYEVTLDELVRGVADEAEEAEGSAESAIAEVIEGAAEAAVVKEAVIAEAVDAPVDSAAQAGTGGEGSTEAASPAANAYEQAYEVPAATATTTAYEQPCDAPVEPAASATEGANVVSATPSASPTASAPVPPPPPEGAVPVQPAGEPVAPAATSQAAEPTKPKNPLYTFPYPLLVALVYLVIGFCFGWWHPGWVLFFTIPFYYWIASVIVHDPEYAAHHGGNTD